MLNLDAYPVPAPDVVGRTVDDPASKTNEAVLVLPSKGQVKVLNEVGARIWTLADGTRSLKEISAMICIEYQVEPQEADADTLQFAAELAERGIILLADHPITPPSR